MPYTPDEFRANHLFGCRLDPDHVGACLLDRPFRIREDGGREYVDEHEVDDGGRWLKLTHLPESAPHEGDDARGAGVRSLTARSAPHEGDDAQVLPEVTPHPRTSAPHDAAGVTPVTPARSSAPRDEGQQRDKTVLLDSTDAAVREVRWIAREARALREVDDPERRARLVERKRALLAYIAATTGERP